MAVYAHSRRNSDDRPWQELREHLECVAKAAAGFAPPELAEMTRIAGLWHDVGKYQAAFQDYIGADPESSNESVKSKGVPHAIVGAALAFEKLPPDEVRGGLPIALAIAAHHGSLHSVDELQSNVKLRGLGLLAAARQGGLPLELEEQSFAAMDVSPLSVRMLFSALVDADLLDTEAWDLQQKRSQRGETLEVLRDRLDAFCDGKMRQARASAKTDKEYALAGLRHDVYQACREAAAHRPGAFTLTVPTGGGKTLSGLAFALHHAVSKGKSRVIVVAPYTSILEQTAQVYRDALGEDNVIEHHSNLSPMYDTDRNRQASENWDAPVIVTTSVQFFESLYAAHKRPCRKLHRIANSVVLLDEVQTFPAALLQPIHAALKQLVERFGVSVVHGTATQPLLASENGVRKDVLPPDLRMPMQEIIPDPTVHFNTMRDRFKMEVMGDLEEPLDPAVLAAAAARQHSALIITHRRDDARELAEMLGPQCLHLSAAMCAAHRTVVLNEARARLHRGEPCLLVSTQLIEAGVDIDFPVVYRAMAGLDTLAQAAGRCNRAMRLPQPGRFVVYRAASDPPPGTPRLGLQVASTMFAKGTPDLSDPALFPKYSRKVLNLCETDKEGVVEAENRFDFPEVAAKFRMIDEATISVIAPYGDARALADELQHAGPSRDRYRALQRFTVGLRENAFQALYKAGWIEPVLKENGQAEPVETLWTVRKGESTVYDSRFGFAGEKQVKLRPLIG